MNRFVFNHCVAGSTVFPLIIHGCGGEPDPGPPTILLGDSPCVECGMIISDERFATATMVEGQRGVEPMLFDDFNCQLNFEKKYPDLDVVTRWSHDHATSTWSATREGWFVRSDKIHTPMASSLAFFADRADADQFADLHAGNVVSFEALMVETE